MRFRVKAHAGLLAVTDFAAKLAGGRVEAAVSLKSPDPGANVPSQDLTALASVRLKNIDLGRLTAEFVKDAHKVKKVANVSVEKLLVGKLTAALDAQSRGSHMAALMAALNGEVGLVVEDGVASAVLIEALGLDLSQALSDVWTAKKYVAMPCAVAKIRFVRGVGTVEKVVLSTSDSDVSLVGDVNLGGETFDFKIEAHPKDPSLGSLRIPILARGPFADPKVSIDGREAGVKVLAGVILGAITPAAAALVLLEPGDQPKGICTELKPMISAIKRKEQTAVSR